MEIANATSDSLTTASLQLRSDVENHFIRAMSILKIMDEHDNEKISAFKLLEADPSPVFVISQNKTIKYANEVAKNLLNLENGNNIESLPFANTDLSNIKQIIKQMDLAPFW